MCARGHLSARTGFPIGAVFREFGFKRIRRTLDNDSIYCVANVFLAVLYYTTGHYQMAIDHCNLVTRSEDHSQCSWHVVHGTFLLKLDDDIDNVLGLSVFYKY